MSFKPLADRILVKVQQAEEKTTGGIILPDTAKEKPQKGNVIAVGPGRVNDKGNRVPMEVKPGDIVIFAKYGGMEIKFEGIEHKVLTERDILAVVEE
jgi:chaperonin GroES